MRRLAALLLAALFLLPAPPIGAQGSAETDATALLREAYVFIQEYALRRPDPQALLTSALTAVEGQLASTGAPPSLTGDEAADLETAALYLAATVRGLAPARADLVLGAALRAMVQVLDDTQAAIFPPEEFAEYLQGLRGQHAGIGVQVHASAGVTVISDVTPGGPAARAGLLAGDALVEINGQPTTGRTPDRILDALHGRPGTVVTVVAQRATAMIRLTLTREVVRESPVRFALIDSRVAYLRLLEFSRDSSPDVGRALAALRHRGAQALLLDLRRNTGGLVDESVGVASFFLHDGIVAMEERRGGLVPLNVKPVQPFPGPVVVLVDGLTASAGEIVAGALQDAGAPLVGLTTYGKATVQSVSIPPLPKGWGIRVTTARYYTRQGRMVEGRGLRPDVVVPMSAELIQSSRDQQLHQAIIQARLRLSARAGGR